MASLDLNGSSALGTTLTQLLLSDDIEPGAEPSYQICKTLYLYHPLGQKMAESPIAMAQFKPRDITVPGSPEERVIKAFNDEWKAINADKIIFNVGVLSRIYGVASVACLTEGTPTDRPLDFTTLASANISFNVYDPLNTAGSLVLNQTPLAMDFLKSTAIRVDSATFHRSRAVVLMNEQPIYLGYTNSAFGYVGRSVYQRALFPLKSFIQTMMTDDLVSSKVGVLVAKIKQVGSIVDNMMTKLFGLKREVVKAAKTYGVISIAPDEAIESLNMQNLEGPMMASRKNILENVAVAADMPAKLLNSETFVEGFGEGTEDAKHVARYVDRVRTWMDPLYDFFTKIVMYRAWNAEFYATIQAEFPAYKNKSHLQAFVEWKNAFVATWPSLLTEPESERAKSDKVKLDSIISLVETLAPEMDPENKATLIQWAADNFNSLDTIFEAPLNLDYVLLAEYDPVEAMAGEDGDEEGDGDEKKPKRSDSATIKLLVRALAQRDRRTRPARMAA